MCPKRLPRFQGQYRHSEEPDSSQDSLFQATVPAVASRFLDSMQERPQPRFERQPFVAGSGSSSPWSVYPLQDHTLPPPHSGVPPPSPVPALPPISSFRILLQYTHPFHRYCGAPPPTQVTDTHLSLICPPTAPSPQTQAFEKGRSSFRIVLGITASSVDVSPPSSHHG